MTASHQKSNCGRAVNFWRFRIIKMKAERFGHSGRHQKGRLSANQKHLSTAEDSAKLFVGTSLEDWESQILNLFSWHCKECMTP